MAVDKLLDHAIAGTEDPDFEQAADPDDDRANGRPPHPVDRQLMKAVLKAI